MQKDLKKILIVGAGFSGAVIGRHLAEAGFSVDIIDANSNVAGNCFTKIDGETGVTVHVHGPHIFHTDSEEVWNYVRTFGEFKPYKLQVKATTQGRVFSLPINLLTINQFFNRTFSPLEAEAFVASVSDPAILEPANFEEQALKFLGRDLYESFFKGYPTKQWGYHPSKLPSSVLKRLPIRFTYDDNYFAHKFQGIPSEGYTSIVQNILNHDCIRLSLRTPYDKSMDRRFDHVFFSGRLDEWFDYQFGHLQYRTLDFVESRHIGDFQGCAVMSFPDENVPFTRITEHKHFAPWESHSKTIVFHEYSRMCGVQDTPYYPLRLAEEQPLLKQYIALANEQKNVSFVGRLGTYRYLDMDVTIGEALNTAKEFVRFARAGLTIPQFFANPL